MAARDPTVAQDQPEVGPVTRREWSGYIVWRFSRDPDEQEELRQEVKRSPMASRDPTLAQDQPGK